VGICSSVARQMNLKEKNLRFLFWATLVMSLVCYVLQGYFLQRHQTAPMLTCFLILFLSYFFWLKNVHRFDFKDLIIFSVVFRLVFTFSVPALSDDFYRFIWDGELWVNGINSFAHTPREIVTRFDIRRLEELFPFIYGKDYHTVYPPVAQLVFRLSAYVSANLLVSLLVLRLVIYVFEFCTIWILWRLLKQARLPVNNLFIYALNPLIILEFSGNLHHEAYVIFFLSAMLLFLYKQNTAGVAITFSGAVMSKLLPLIFLPALSSFLSKRRFFAMCVVIVTLMLTGFFLMGGPEVFAGMTSGLALYFQKFEFNPSLWYLMRAAGNIFAGYNIIAFAGPVMGFISAVIILGISLRKPPHVHSGFDLQKLTDLWAIILTVYLVFSTTVHPWYITPLIMFSVFGNFRFSLLWSGLILFTYSGYHITGYEENLLIPAIEYLAVFTFLFFEWTVLKRKIA
jgi:hypothetical protein